MDLLCYEPVASVVEPLDFFSVWERGITQREESMGKNHEKSGLTLVQNLL